MLNRILQDLFPGIRRLLAALGAKDFGPNFLSRGFAFAPVPVLGNAPVAVDSAVLVLVASLALLAGLCIVLLYRHLSTQSKELRTRAGNAEAELRTLLATTDEAVLMLDPSGIIRGANSAAEELFRRSSGDLCGRDVTEVIPQRLVLADVTRQGIATFEACAARLGQEKVPVRVILSSVELVAGRTYFLLARPRPAGTIQNSSVEDPIWKSCHDLNNHLTGVLGNLSMLLMNGPADDSLREQLSNAKRSTLKAQEVVRKIHALAKGEAPEQRDPATTPTIVPMPAPVAVPASTPTGCRILILDDEPAIGALVSAALEAMGCEVVSKQEAGAAIDACQEAVRAGRRFDLVISDLSLPGEMDGNKAVTRMRLIDPQIKTIISSGFDQDPVMHHYREHGYAGALSKPFELGQLVRLVREVLGSDNANRKTA